MKNIFENHDLMFNRFGEEIEHDDRLDIFYKIRRTFGFIKTYVSLKVRRLMSVSPSVDSHDCVIKIPLADLKRKLDEKIRKLEEVGEVVADRSVIDTAEVNERVSRQVMKNKKRNIMDRWN